jgi:CRP-like cAMP-binding protein
LREVTDGFGVGDLGGIDEKEARMFGADHKVKSLKDVPFLRTCSDEDIRRLARVGDLAYVREGEVLTTEGSPRPAFFILLDGRARASDGAELEAGDVHGAEDVLAHRSVSTDVRMTTDGKVIVFGAREFASVMRRAPGFAFAVARRLAAAR